jgi:hypothetical protein
VATRCGTSTPRAKSPGRQSRRKAVRQKHYLDVPTIEDTHGDLIATAVTVAARGADETTAWRQPVDLTALCAEAGAELPGLFAARPNMQGWSDHASLAQALLGDDPMAIAKPFV